MRVGELPITIRNPRLGRVLAVAGCLFLSLALTAGCGNLNSQRSLKELHDAGKWVDPVTQDEVVSVVRTDELLQTAEHIRASRRPPVLYPKRSVLVLSGGGAYGAYCAGFLAGWSETGTRPEFDVVTGISTGALIGVLAFLGPEFDSEIEHITTRLRTEDVYRRRRILQSILGESIAITDPLMKLIEHAMPDERIDRVAAEHAKGRRLYIGTSDLETRRQVVWDMGAVATKRTPESRELFRKVVLASASIPAFFPPVKIPVTVDGVKTTERHIDGGVSSSMFFVPPHVPREFRDSLPPGWLFDSDLYILVAGKMYGDPVQVRFRTFAVASNSISTIIYDQTRSDLHKLFTTSMLTGMNYHVATIPQDLDVPKASTEFEPKQLKSMFDAGKRDGRLPNRWRNTPPGGEPGEGSKYRGGTVLTARGPGLPSAPRPEPGSEVWPAPRVEK
ncbi:MAG TPA: patatin-like phospholipase family protein [Gemmataceae bacterium]|nr:patatin-like phospholipase family protein [Gemmataceae bacterium]